MEHFGLAFHHVGMAVRRPAEAFLFLTSMGFTKTNQVFDPLQAVNLAMFEHPTMPGMEVIWPGEGASPIDNLISQRSGHMYHLCYIAPDAAASLAAMQATGLRVIHMTEAKPAVLFGGVPVSFHQVHGVGLIELIHGTPVMP